MSAFTPSELDYLRTEPRLGRIATVGADGTPHVVPTGWSYNAELDTIDVGGRDLASTKKYRDVARSGRAAIVVDDVLPPWRPRGTRPLIRTHPERVVSWGLGRGKSERGGHDVGQAGRPAPGRSVPPPTSSRARPR